MMTSLISTCENMTFEESWLERIYKARNVRKSNLHQVTQTIEDIIDYADDLELINKVDGFMEQNSHLMPNIEVMYCYHLIERQRYNIYKQLNIVEPNG